MTKPSRDKITKKQEAVFSAEPVQQVSVPEVPHEESHQSFSSVGGILFKRARLLRKETIEGIAHKLHIKKSYLKAIEADDFEELPELSYAVGFVRTYATYLGLDVSEVVDHFKAYATHDKRLHSIAVEQDVLFTAKTPQPRQDFIMTLGIVVGVLFILWFYFKEGDTFSLEAYTFHESKVEGNANNHVEGERKS